ncbi:MAG: carboxypeptidase-like regulatory domain-containing protein [Acidobacteria bacterium]|nr:carboxypeptidase-like regulatory domain-containing protein [Acidobacteriota bacterium]MCA1651763.1 carboxypeptidase-like regulatory domain-containing protein [Acidobacteriota bacterium]
MVVVTGPNGETLSTTTDEHGMYSLSNLPSGLLTVTSELPGFSRMRRTLVFDQRPRQVDFQMTMSAAAETVTVTADAPLIDRRSSARVETVRPDAAGQTDRRSETAPPPQAAPSQNVINMQRRVAGVLPVRMEVPRSGTSYRFVRLLVLDEETTVSLRYKTR